MDKFDKKVDAYIARSAPFAHEILEHLRELVHRACPAVEETIKWGFPHFEYNGILCSMAAFKNHCAFGFWKGVVMTDPYNVMTVVGKTSMGNFDRITSIESLPTNKIILEYIREAAKLNKEGIKLPSKSKPKKKVSAEMPDYFLKALKQNKKTLTIFNALSDSHKKEYMEWITEAKSGETRKKRMETAVGWISEGKSRNWKYVKK
jgi:uncharacterized protein YdeI (YjbR/CyaY-like superfamily)